MGGYIINPIQPIRLARAYKTAVHEGKQFQRIIEPEPVMRSTASVDGFDEAGRRTLRRTYWTFIRMLSAIMPSRKSMDVVDFGCGPANLDIMLSQAMLSLKITGIELGTEMIVKAHRNIEIADRESRVAIVHGDCTSVNLPTINQNAASISLFLAHHLNDLDSVKKLLRNMLRHIAPGGAVLLVDFVRPPTRELADGVVKLSPSGIQATDEDLRSSLLAAFSQEEWEEAVSVVNMQGIRKPLRVTTMGLSVFPPSIPVLTAVYLEGDGAKIPLTKNQLPQFWSAGFEDRMLMGIVESGFRKGGFRYL